MPDDDEKQKRADRLSRHRKDRTQQRGQSDQPDQPAQPENQDQREQSEQQEKPEQPEQLGQPDNPDERGQTEQQSVKDQYQGTYIYIPPDLREQMDLIADTLDLNRRQRNGNRVEKIRHFYPLVVSLGLERINNTDEEELEQQIAEFDSEHV